MPIKYVAVLEEFGSYLVCNKPYYDYKTVNIVNKQLRQKVSCWCPMHNMTTNVYIFGKKQINNNSEN